jgi:hypothetical protein
VEIWAVLCLAVVQASWVDAFNNELDQLKAVAKILEDMAKYSESITEADYDKLLSLLKEAGSGTL